MLYHSPHTVEIPNAKVKLLLRREDLNHPTVSGNKWWKLKYNLQKAKEEGHDTLLTFGGAYSNHIRATAAAAQLHGLKSIGLIRGEETLPLNASLSFAKQCGMELHYVNRTSYREKKFDLAPFGRCCVLPEGGTNEEALRGCEEWGYELQRISFDYVCLAVGTGGTMGGIARSLGHQMAIGIPVLKGNFLEEEVKKFAPGRNFKMLNEYHFGGYAKSTPGLEKFISQMNIPLEPVYSGKMLFGVMDAVEKGFFDNGSTVLALHTGGIIPPINESII